MCVGCGKKRNKWTLTRFVLSENGAVIKDFKMNRPGRGIYICDDPNCWEILADNKRIGRAFRIKDLTGNVVVIINSKNY